MRSSKQVNLSPPEFPGETDWFGPRLAIATGDEAVVPSPALVMQQTIAEIFQPAEPRRLVLANTAALLFALSAVITICSAFWVMVARAMTSFLLA